MFKRRHFAILALALLLVLTGTVGVQAQTYEPYPVETLMRYFAWIDVIEDRQVDPQTELEWEDFEELYTAALPGHEFNEELITSTYLDYPQLVAQIIHAVDQEEFIFTYSDVLDRQDKILAAADVLGLKFYHDGDRPILVDALNMLLKARIDLGYFVPHLGHIDDYDIYQESRLKRASIAKDDFQEAVPELFTVGVRGLETIPGGTFTGYNIKDYNENPLFAQDLMIRYDHGDMGHLLQMISLLRRDNLDVEWDVMGRISSYVHHVDDWGEPDPESVIAEIDETRVVVGSASYDILLEFPNRSEMEEFKTLVDDFARRKEEDTTGLIRAPYYAPVYGTISQLPEYEEVVGVRIKHDHYYLQSYVLVDYAEEVVAELEEITADMDGDFSIETATYYVNPEFVGYLEDNLTD